MDRDVDGREVDFVVVERRKPVMLVEVKLSAEPAAGTRRTRFVSAYVKTPPGR